MNPVPAAPYRSDYLLEVQSPQLKNEHSNTYGTAILATDKALSEWVSNPYIHNLGTLDASLY